MSQRPECSSEPDPERSGESSSESLEAADDPLTREAAAGWRLGWDCLDQAEAGAGPNPTVLETAIRHLETAVVDGVDGVVLLDPELFLVLGHLLLLFPQAHQLPDEQALEIVDDAHGAFIAGLDCPDLNEPSRLLLLEAAAQGCWQRVALLERGADIYHPSPALAAAQDGLVSAAEELFVAVPAGQDGSDSVAVGLIHALAIRIVGRPARGSDIPDLIRLVRARPDLRRTEGAAQAGALVLTVSQALLLAFEREGLEETLTAAADLADEAGSWPDLPGGLRPFLSMMLANAIINAPDEGILATRLDEARRLLDEAVGQLAADDPHRPQADLMRAMLLERTATRRGDAAAIEEATREISRTAARHTEQGGTYGPVLTGLLGSVLDTRFRRRQDLRDARISKKMLALAMAGSYESETQRAMLEANQGINLLRMAWTTGELGPADEAVGMLRNAMATLPPGSPLDYQLHGRLAAALLSRAQFEPWAQGQATLGEAWNAAARAAQQEPPTAQSLVIQMAIAAALADAGQEIQAAGERAAQRLHEIRASAALRDIPHQLIDMAASMLSGIAATRQGASLQSVEAALAQLETLSQGADYPGNMRRVLGMQHGRVLRRRDNLRWLQSVQAAGDQPLTTAVERRRITDWLQQGGSDISEIRHMLGHSLLAEARESPDRRRSRDLGVEVLRGHALQVLLQSGTEDAILTARAASGDAHEVITWCLADGADDQAIIALETGRGMTLLAAEASGSVSDQLEAAGEAELAREWRRSQEAIIPATADGLTVPEDIRHRVLDRLADTGDLAAVLRPPDREELAAAVRQLGYDVLVYLIPQGIDGTAAATGWAPRGGGGADRPGGALIVTDSGQVRWQDLPDLTVGEGSATDHYLRAHQDLLAGRDTIDDRDAWRSALQETCQWAWEAAMGPLRPSLAHLHPTRRARVVLVPVGALCVIPWHAAYPAADQQLPPSERRYALDAAVFSYAASGALLGRVAHRTAPVLGSSVLLVGDPGGDLPYARAEAQALRAAFYPQATIWGEPPERTDGVATPARLRTALATPGYSLLHYAGHATLDTTRPGSSALVMGSQRLRAERISRLAPQKSYFVFLAACTTHLTADAFDEVFTLSTAFLLGGASTVLGSLWRVNDVGTAVMTFMVHQYLSRGARPADALHRAQLWMLDPARGVPESMPAALQDALPSLDLTDLVLWAPLTHQGH